MRPTSGRHVLMRPATRGASELIITANGSLHKILKARRRILILGNSLSFGEGTDIDNRFDVRMLSALPDARIINTGTMGYGTDQEYVAFLNWRHLLEPGDIVLIVLNQSDYFDVLRQRFFGRAKPYFEKVDGRYVLRPPAIGLWERWSDWSRVASLVARFVEWTPSESLDPSQSIEIIRFILGQNPRRSAARRESGLGPSRHPRFPRTEARPFLDDLLPICGCLHRSRRRVGRRSTHLLPDGHWSASGHAAVAQALLKRFTT